MSSALPLRLIKVRPVAEVPLSVYNERAQQQKAAPDHKRAGLLGRLLRQNETAQAQRNQSRQNTEHHFNAAAWLHFREPPLQPVSLVLTYRDQRGEFAVIVDESVVGQEGSVMLSGSVSISARGDIEDLKVGCLGVENSQHFRVDELHVQRIESLQSQPQQRQA
ncbi:hypothetical protein [Mangrovitalea sediminis]|uniref:hypothetical protein n=1 Tax=Mangrovitalea sediminis TaxID=1982043 RepID=UPI000BE5E61F|nr:hypothetical protein [Mangrovitalea sediminis]